MEEKVLVDELYDQLVQAMAEARNSRREAFEESERRGKAERDAIEAIRTAKAAESIYKEELKQRDEIESALMTKNEELEETQRQKDEVIQELHAALQSQYAESDELLKRYKEERDHALIVAEELKQQLAETSSSSNLSPFFSEFSFSEIEEATRSFDPSLKIGEGGYGSIYKGVLRHTEVAIKMLSSRSSQGPPQYPQYQQEVVVLSKLRHPNIVTLIGACSEEWTLIYEYLPNGSLEDRLNRKDNSSPISWQTRIRIAAELCSVLVFLHSSKPHGIVHCDLKSSNILLDANFVSKLSNFGICRVIYPDENSSSDATASYRTNASGTFGYINPEFVQMEELTAKSDVFSFGIILLQLLTGRPAIGITKDVQNAIDNQNLKSVLDNSAGDWPFVQALQLAQLALRCAEMNHTDRPDLGSEVWRVLERMRASCGGAPSTLRLGSEERSEPPSHFICPIFQDVMENPHVAADGFTYEAEALRSWLDRGEVTSPMTNLQLEHTNLVPNLALRSAIKEWQEHH